MRGSPPARSIPAAEPAGRIDPRRLALPPPGSIGVAPPERGIGREDERQETHGGSVAVAEDHGRRRVVDAGRTTAGGNRRLVDPDAAGGEEAAEHEAGKAHGDPSVLAVLRHPRLPERPDAADE